MAYQIPEIKTQKSILNGKINVVIDQNPNLPAHLRPTQTITQGLCVIELDPSTALKLAQGILRELDESAEHLTNPIALVAP